MGLDRNCQVELMPQCDRLHKAGTDFVAYMLGPKLKRSAATVHLLGPNSEENCVTFLEPGHAYPQDSTAAMSEPLYVPLLACHAFQRH